MDAAGCAGREHNYVWNSLIDCTKSAGYRNAFLHAALLANHRRFDCPLSRAIVLAGIAQMDAAHLADPFGRDPVDRCLGRDYRGLAVASAAVLSRTRSGIAQFN